MRRIRVWSRASLVLFFLVPFVFRPARAAEAVPCVWTGIEKIVTIGDLHGDYGAFVAILQATGLANNRLAWTGGKVHLVQMGDIMDRGDDARKIFDLIRRLEKDAAKAGGFVHMLIGNHEEMAITGLSFEFPGYVSVKEFVSFLPDDYRRVQEDAYRRAHGLQADLSELWQSLMKDQEARALFTANFNRLYGRWIAGHNAAIRINDSVFVHGGFNEKYSAMKLEAVNDLYRSEFQRIFRGESFNPTILFASDGPIWNRDLAQENPEEYAPTVEKTLANLGVRHMIIAHTPQLVEKDMSRYAGKIWIVDTGISGVYRRDGGRLSALIIEGEKFTVWWENDGQK